MSNLSLSAKEFLTNFDSITPNPFVTGLCVVTFHGILFYSYLIWTGRVRGFFSRIKSNKDFFEIALDSMWAGILEQASMLVYLKIFFDRIFGDKYLVRIMISVIFTVVHVGSFNTYYEYITLILQSFNILILSLVYTRLDHVESFIVHMMCNFYGLVITYTVYQLMIKTKLFRTKLMNITPINIENNIINSAKVD